MSSARTPALISSLPCGSGPAQLTALLWLVEAGIVKHRMKEAALAKGQQKKAKNNKTKLTPQQKKEKKKEKSAKKK